MRIDPKFRPLSAELQNQLLREYKSKRNPAVKERLVLANLKLVAKLVSMIASHRHHLYEDLFSEGCCGLVEAVERFEPNRGWKFSTYATHWIKCYCHDFIIDNFRIVRMPTSCGKKKAFYALQSSGLNHSSLGESIGIPQEEVEEVAVRMRPDVWLDRPIFNQEEDNVKFGDLLEDPFKLNDEVEASEKNTSIKEFIDAFKASLSDNEKIVLSERVFKEKKLHEVGKYLNITKERIRQIETRLLSRLTEMAVVNRMDRYLK